MRQKSKLVRAAPLLAPLLLGGLAACDPGSQAVLAGASLVTFVHSDKTLGDHVATWAFDKDCSALTLANGEGYCQDFLTEEQLQTAEAEARLGRTYCYRTLGEINCYLQPDEMASSAVMVR